MYRIYHTQGLVLRDSPNGEASKTLALFTAEFGLVHAHAQGIRYEKSKLRYVLRPYSLARINLVRGRSGWRVVSAACEDALEVLGSGTETRQTVRAIAEISALLLRLLRGEEKDPELFASVHAGVKEIMARARRGGSAWGAYSTDELRIIKLMTLAHILKRLGYWREQSALAPLIEASDFSNVLLASLVPLASRAADAVKHSLEASQL